MIRFPTSIVQCEADFKFNELNEDFFNSFGIGLVPDMDINILSNQSYYLYPRILDYIDYMSSLIDVHGRQLQFSLYQNPQLDYTGVRIHDEECFSKIIEFFVSLRDKIKTVKLLDYSSIPINANIFTNLYVV